MIKELRCKNCDHLLLKNAVVVIASIKCSSCGFVNISRAYSADEIAKDKFINKIVNTSINTKL